MVQLKQFLKAKQKNIQRKQTKISLGEFIKAGMYYLIRQKESGMLNIRFTNFQHCFHHFKSVMLAAASNYKTVKNGIL